MACFAAAVAGIGISTGVASAAPACPDWVDSETATECIVSSLKSPGAGPWTFEKTLHLTGTGHIDGSSNTAEGITLNVNGADDIDLIMDEGAKIETEETDGPADAEPAGPITINVSRNLVMAKGTKISAEDQFKRGRGGDITINVGGDMAMGGTAGSDNCFGDGVTGAGNFGDPDAAPFTWENPSLGAWISSRIISSTGNNDDDAGNITINVGEKEPVPTGNLTMERCSLIDASSRATGGEVKVTVGKSAQIAGMVISHGGRVDPFAKGGGPVSIVVGCKLDLDNGVVSSIGRDPGADLVHLEGCKVLVHGLVQSRPFRTGGHGDTPQVVNQCESDPVAHPPAAGANDRFTGCVEIWGRDVEIDALNHNGNVNTNLIVKQRGWIDVFASKSLNIIGGALGSGNWAIQSNAATGTANQQAGLVTLKVTEGKLTSSGQAVQANAPTGGSTGGQVIMQSGGGVSEGVELGNSYIEARGGQSGQTSVGGSIAVRAFNGALTGSAPGHLDASSNDPVDVGSVNLTSCLGTTYTGTITPAENNVADNTGVCGSSPSLPAAAATALVAKADCCDICNGTVTTTTTSSTTTTSTSTTTTSTTSTTTTSTTTTTVPDTTTTTTTTVPDTTTTTSVPETTTTSTVVEQATSTTTTVPEETTTSTVVEEGSTTTSTIGETGTTVTTTPGPRSLPFTGSGGSNIGLIGLGLLGGGLLLAIRRRRALDLR